MVHQKQDGEDLVFVAHDRSFGGGATDGVRINGTNGTVRSPYEGGSGSAPGITAGNAAQLGTGPSAAVAGTAVACEVTLTSGTAPSAAVGGTAYTAFTIAIPSGIFATAPFCSVEPSNAVAAQLEAGGITGGTQALMFYYDRTASSPTSLVFKAVSNGTPTLAGTTAYKLQIWIAG